MEGILRYLRSYRDAWVVTLGASQSRLRLCLDFFACLLMQVLAMHLYGQRIDGLTCTNVDQINAQPAADQQPCSISSPLLRTASRVLSLRSSLTALAKDTHPAGSLPTELVLLALYACATATMCAMVLAPRFFLCFRSYIIMPISIVAHSCAFSSLITHPDSEPSQHWRTYLPHSGVGLVWQQLMFRVRATVTEILTHWLQISILNPSHVCQSLGPHGLKENEKARRYLQGDVLVKAKQQGKPITAQMPCQEWNCETIK